MIRLTAEPWQHISELPEMSGMHGRLEETLRYPGCTLMRVETSIEPKDFWKRNKGPLSGCMLPFVSLPRHSWMQHRGMIFRCHNAWVLFANALRNVFGCSSGGKSPAFETCSFTNTLVWTPKIIWDIIENKLPVLEKQTEEMLGD